MLSAGHGSNNPAGTLRLTGSRKFSFMNGVRKSLANRAVMEVYRDTWNGSFTEFIVNIFNLKGKSWSFSMH